MMKRLALMILFAANAAAADFQVQKVAEGVYAVIRNQPAGMMFNANNVFIINDHDVVVDDANATPSASREVIAELRKLTAKPVRYVVNTHWHEDHIIGNSAWRDAWPGVEFIGHATTRDDLPTVGLSNRKQMFEGAPPMIAGMKLLIEKKKTLSGKDMTEEDRISYLSDIAQVERYMTEAPKAEVILPSISVGSPDSASRGSYHRNSSPRSRAHPGRSGGLPAAGECPHHRRSRGLARSPDRFDFLPDRLRDHARDVRDLPGRHRSARTAHWKEVRFTAQQSIELRSETGADRVTLRFPGLETAEEG